MYFPHPYGYILLPYNYEIRHVLSSSRMPSASLDAEAIVVESTHTHAPF